MQQANSTRRRRDRLLRIVPFLVTLLALAFTAGPARSLLAATFSGSITLPLVPQSGDTSDWKTYTNLTYGYSIKYPPEWHLIPAWETGAGVVAQILSSEGGEDPTVISAAEQLSVAIVIENYPPDTTLDRWVEEDEEEKMMITVKAVSPITVDGIEGLRRELQRGETSAVAIYLPKGNKIYILNAVPLSSPLIHTFDLMVETFRWTNTESTKPIPTIAPVVEEEQPVQAAGASFPNLEFPFACGATWKISCDYACHQRIVPPDLWKWNKYALDFVNNAGSSYNQSVVAAHRGKVVARGWDKLGGGNIIKVDVDGASGGYLTFYAHLKSFSVPLGAWVKQRQEIGRSDATGYVTGNHIHFALWKDNVSVKPEPMSGKTGFKTGQVFTHKCPPWAPSNLKASAVSPCQINLSWQDNSNNETGFRIYRNGSAIKTVGANVTSYQNAGLKCGTAYSYYVKAYNTYGESGASNTASATTHSCPATPSNLSASAVSQSQINLSWKDNSNNETGFKIYRDGSHIATVGANVTSYQNTGLTCDTNYSYYVKAYNCGGESGASNTASATTYPCTPTAPSDLSASAVSQSQIDLSWQDNSGNEDGFKIYRDGSYLTSVGANTTSFEDSGLNCGTTYSYHVTAYNIGGESAPTNTASATTHRCLPVVHNGSFEQGPAIPKHWKGNKNLTPDDRRVCWTAHDGSCSFRMVGASARKSLRQVGSVPGSASDTFTLSGWSKARNPLRGGGRYCLQATVFHTDGTKERYRTCFGKRTHDWQRRKTTFTAAKDYSKIVVSLLYCKQSGRAWFDDVRLVAH